MMTRPMWLLILVVLIASWWFLSRRAQGQRINGSQARELIQGGARLLDVRTAGEFRGQHLQGAINIPVQELPRRLKELTPKERPVVVYCRSGHRSGIAAKILKEAGFSAVHDLGPMTAW